MRGVLVLVLAACGGHAGTASQPAPATQVPRLPSPTPIDPRAPGAAYLTTIALQLQPGWGQFLDDCRLRLPATHPLNQLALATTAELVIDRRGRVVDVQLGHGSGNADFDRAIRDAIADATPLVEPPLELLSDDDRVHVRWLFARDRRQAGPATAEVVAVELPLGGVIDRLLGEGDLVRAARRIADAPAGAPRVAATERVMIAALRDALGSADGSVRRAAVDAIARARVLELAGDVRALLTVTSDTELRVTAMAAAGALGDREAVAPLVQQLHADLAEHPRLALAETRALVQLGSTDAAAAAIVAVEPMSPIALEAFALAPAARVAPKLRGWFQHGNTRTRAAVCAAFAGAPADHALDWIEQGLHDPDATVRARCAETAATIAPRSNAALAARLRELAHDRDRAVRARAIAAIVAIDPRWRGPGRSQLVDAADDSAADVRAAYARALATAPPAEAAPALLTLDRRSRRRRARVRVARLRGDRARTRGSRPARGPRDHRSGAAGAARRGRGAR